MTTMEVHGHMSVQFLDRSRETSVGAPLPEFASPGLTGGPALANPAWGGNGDDISRMLPPLAGSTNTFGPFGGLLGMLSGSALLAPLGGLLQQIGSLLQQIFGGGQGGSPIGGGSGEQFFSSATGGSTGDPHLSFNGRTWNDMQSESDLLHSDSFAGGFQLSTVTTPPDAHGITYNQSATIATGYGATSISLDKDGNASVQQNGATFAIVPGSNYDLGNGETVSRAADGTLTVTCANGQGGQIATTMSSNGTGVNVTTSASNVDLGGTLANGAPAGGSGPIPLPWPRPQPIRYGG